MAYPTRNPNVNPYSYCSEAAVQNLSAYLGAAISALTTDQAGNRMEVSVGADQRSLQAGSIATYQTAVISETAAAVAISMEEWGEQAFGYAMGAMNPSDDGTATNYAITATGCTFLLEVYGLLWAQRQYIVDSILAAVPFNYYASPSLGTIEFAIIQGMYARGVMLRGWRRVRFIKPRFEEPRPAGQYYMAEMRLRADIDTIVSIPNQAFTQANVRISATGPGMSSQQVWTLTLSGSGLGGTYTLRLPGYGVATAAISVTATAAQVQAALSAPGVLDPSIGAVTVAGATWTNTGGTYTMTTARSFGQQLPNFVIDSGLLTGSITSFTSAVTTAVGLSDPAQTVTPTSPPHTVP